MLRKRREIEPFEWFVYREDFNSRNIERYNCLKYYADRIKKLKKKAKTKEKFAEELKHEMMWLYWSRCEYEVIIIKEDDKIYLEPWISKNPEEHRIDITSDDLIDWKTFADIHIDRQIYKDKAKIDIFDQLEFRWNEFVDYCWTYRHKYEWRRKDV